MQDDYIDLLKDIRDWLERLLPTSRNWAGWTLSSLVWDRPDAQKFSEDVRSVAHRLVHEIEGPETGFRVYNCREALAFFNAAIEQAEAARKDG